MMAKIVAVRKDENGVINEYKLDNGSIIGVEQAVQMTKDGQIGDCNVGKTKDGKEVIRSNRDNDSSNNLDNLPIF